MRGILLKGTVSFLRSNGSVLKLDISNGYTTLYVLTPVIYTL